MSGAGIFTTVLVGALLSAAVAHGQTAAAPVPIAPPGASAPANTSLEARVAALEAALAEEKATREALAAAQAGAIDPDEVAEEPKLQLYGFMDTGLQRYWLRDDARSGFLPTRAATFVSGNTNVYFDARPLPHWRGLIETRFTLWPQGDYAYAGLGPAKRTDTRLFDLASPSGRDVISWGSVVMERAQVEWSHNDRLTVIAGYFLTPFGIWNVDHGTPTTLSLMLPAFLVQEAVPKQQTGVQLLGSLLAPPWELAYRLFLSNGRTATQFDLSDKKAVGGRLYLRRRGAATVTFGASGLLGGSEDVEKRVVVMGNAVNVTADPTWSFREWVAGVDFALDFGGFRLRSEGVGRHVQYRDGHHAPIASVPNATVPNHYEWYGYLVGAYRWRAIEPYVYLEAGDTGTNQNILPAKGWLRSVGGNLHLSAATQLRLQVAETAFDNIAGRQKVWTAISRLVLAF